MTKLLSLLNLVFGNQTKSNYLEHYINSHKPISPQQVDELTRDYLYHYTTLQGL